VAVKLIFCLKGHVSQDKNLQVVSNYISPHLILLNNTIPSWLFPLGIHFEYLQKQDFFFFYNLIKIWSTILDDIHVQLNMVITSFLGYIVQQNQMRRDIIGYNLCSRRFVQLFEWQSTSKWNKRFHWTIRVNAIN
jgi:hypothetical protein